MPTATTPPAPARAETGKLSASSSDRLEVLPWTRPTSEESAKACLEMLSAAFALSPAIDEWDAKLAQLQDE